MSNRVKNYILNRGSVVIQSDSGIKIYSAGSPEYAQAKEFISEEPVNETGLYNLVNGLENAVKAYKGFRVENDVVFVNNEPLPATLGKRLKGFADEGADYNYLLKFWENLKLNPSYSSVNNLFDFLDRVHCPITKDGLIQCYKTVKDDYFDKWTGKTYKNITGAVIREPRQEVNDDRGVLCGKGLHAGGLNYIHWYGRPDQGDRIMEVFVNPKDFVAVPTDHDFHKARVCEYTVGNEVSWDEVAPTKQAYVRPEDAEEAKVNEEKLFGGVDINGNYDPCLNGTCDCDSDLDDEDDPYDDYDNSFEENDDDDLDDEDDEDEGEGDWCDLCQDYH